MVQKINWPQILKDLKGQNQKFDPKTWWNDTFGILRLRDTICFKGTDK